MGSDRACVCVVQEPFVILVYKYHLLLLWARFHLRLRLGGNIFSMFVGPITIHIRITTVCGIPQIVPSLLTVGSCRSTDIQQGLIACWPPCGIHTYIRGPTYHASYTLRSKKSRGCKEGIINLLNCTIMLRWRELGLLQATVSRWPQSACPNNATHLTYIIRAQVVFTLACLLRGNRPKNEDREEIETIYWQKRAGKGAAKRKAKGITT